MALFTGVEPDPDQGSGRGAVRGSGQSRRIGGWLVTAAILGAGIFALVPSPYVIERPGPVYNTLGEVKIDGEEVPLIEIPDEKTYPTSGSLDLLTVNTLGNRTSLPNWFGVITAWFDPSQAVLPLDLVYPPGYSVEDSNADAQIQMANSQKDAVAAALTELGYDIPRVVTVGALTPDSPSEGILEPGDLIREVDGRAVTSVQELRRVIANSGAGTPLPLTIERDGSVQTVSVTPRLSTQNPPAPIVGVYPSIHYTFPIDVTIQLQNVGGPSGGQMFALGIIDKLTPGSLTGGAAVAGTGTIDARGTIGPIGGIRQKLFGAQEAGADWFLAPSLNCDEVAGHVPDGLRVVAVTTLADSVAALETIASGTGTDTLPSCAASS